MGEGLGLYDQKPRKVGLDSSTRQPKPKNYTIPPTSPVPPTPAPMASAKTPVPPPKESFARRYKFVWPVLLAVNLALGGYLFLRTKKKDTVTEDEEVPEKAVPPPAESRSPPITEETLVIPKVTESVNAREPIPEPEQRQLFNWILDEKRKFKPSNPEEKKRVDEEKTILKQFIRSKSIPTL